MIVTWILGVLMLTGFLLTFWHFLAGMCHRLRPSMPATPSGCAPGLSVLKPLKGVDEHTRRNLESWLAQSYPAPVEILFGVADPADPVCAVVEALLEDYPGTQARLVICPEFLGTNHKVSTLIQLEQHARQETLVLSDADVRVPPDFLAHFVSPLADPSVGLVHCFYRLTDPSTAALRWEAIGVNGDFWAQVIQARQLGMSDFALGAVMGLRRADLKRAGGLEAVADYLADDFHLGHRVASLGRKLHLLPMVVDCHEPAVGWRESWRHQLRWARTIRYSRPWAYAFSLLGNGTLWALLFWLFANTGGFWVPLVPESMRAGGQSLPELYLAWGTVALAGFALFRILTVLMLQARMTGNWNHAGWWWLVPVKDLFQAVLWVGSWLGNNVEWRGERLRLGRGGRIRVK